VVSAKFLHLIHQSTNLGSSIPDDLKPQLLEMGICEVLIPLTNSQSLEVQGNSAAALGNLSSKAAEDYAPFNAVWNSPEGGLHAYLVKFLGNADQTFQHIAVWVSR
jgi:vacuolar protein 8